MEDGLAAALTQDRLAARIAAYEGLGVHRTGWGGDDRAADWLIEELRAVGVTAERERFPFLRTEVQRARVTWADGVIDGEAMFDGGFTRVGGVPGDLCDETESDLFGKIVVANGAARDPKWIATNVRAHYQTLAEQGVLGVVLPSGDPNGEVRLRDAEHIRQPFEVPVLVVRPRDARRLTGSLLMGAEATIEIDADRLESRAYNVWATVPGTDAEAAPVVLVAAKSGWFGCAAERGAPLALWLALAEAVAARPGRRTLHLLASSGAEVRGQGIEDVIRRRAALVRTARCWVELGGSLGAMEATDTKALTSDDVLRGLAQEALASAALPEVVTPAGEVPTTEVRHIASREGRYVAFSATHPYARSAGDTSARVDPEATTRWGAAAHALLRRLLDESTGA